MTLSIRPLEPSDAEVIINIYLLAFGSMPANDAIWKKPIAPSTVQFLINRERNSMLTSRNTYWLGVFDSEKEEVIAYARWHLMDETERQQPPGISDYSPASNHAAKDIFYATIDRSMAEVIGPRTHWELSMLGTAPVHERRGAAALLLKWGIDEAAKDGYPLCLDATVTGKPLYERMGFVAKKENVIDLRPFGVDHTNQTWAMIREGEHKR